MFENAPIKQEKYQAWGTIKKAVLCLTTIPSTVLPTLSYKDLCAVKAEIHGSAEATTAQEQSDSDSGAEANRRDHHYEDIYMPREEQQRRRFVDYMYSSS